MKTGGERVKRHGAFAPEDRRSALRSETPLAPFRGAGVQPAGCGATPMCTNFTDGDGDLSTRGAEEHSPRREPWESGGN